MDIFYFFNKIYKFFLVFGIFFLFGCSNSTPNVSNCSSTVIFSYSDDESLPDVKFSAFVGSISDVRRVDYLTFKNRSSNFEWIVDNPYIFADSNNSWACGLNLKHNKNQKIPLGIYDVVFQDAQGNKADDILNVFYPEELYNKNFKNAVEILEKQTLKKIAIYDKDNNLLYYGFYKNNWNDDKSIFGNIEHSFKYRICYQATDNSYLVLSKYIEKNIEN